MAAITIKNIPDELYQQLKLAAEHHHRSINSELISCLEKVLTPKKVSAEEHLAGARNIRQRLQNINVTQDDLNAAKNMDRP
jgi:plasmid stability protein